jgi:hypothetical protein
VVLEGFKYSYSGSVVGAICEAGEGGFVSLTNCTIAGQQLVDSFALLSATDGEVCCVLVN